MDSIRRSWSEWKRSFVKALRETPPQELARGLSVGFFFGLLPVIGLQVAGAWVVATWLQGNRIAACLMTGVTNPLTSIPIYSACYWIGDLIVPGPPLPAFHQAMKDGVSGLISFGGEAYGTLWMGTLVCGVSGSIVVYFVTLNWARRGRPKDLISLPGSAQSR